jgi:hypothetical protein
MSFSEAQRAGVALRIRRRRCLRDHRSGARIDGCEGVLIAVGFDTDQVVHLLCKHPNRSSDS